MSTQERATHGGPGWLTRAKTHREEVAAGKIWHPCGSPNEYARAREVLVSWPGTEVQFEDPPDRWLMLDRIDLDAIRREAEGIIRFWESVGAVVHVARPAVPPPPNFMFMRDLAFFTPEGAVMARMATEQRAGEERHAARAIAEIGVPIVAAPRGTMTFEGADALWMNERTVLLGVGRRTSSEMQSVLSELLGPSGVEVVPIEIPAGKTQHILGIVKFVDRDLAVVYQEKVTPPLRKILEENGFRLLELSTDDELLGRASLNFVTVGPRELVMTARAPRTKKRFEEAGIRVHELEVDQYIKAGGGLGCLTNIVRRAD